MACSQLIDSDTKGLPCEVPALEAPTTNLRRSNSAAPPSRRPSFDFGTSFNASFLAEQCSAATSAGTCPLPEDLFPNVADSDTIPACFDFGREQPRSALSASTASETFSMHSLSTNGSCSDDLDELLTWLDKDVPLLGFRTSDVGPSLGRLGLRADPQEVTSPVPQGPSPSQPAKSSFMEPLSKVEAAVPVLRIRIKSQAWRKPFIVVADPLKRAPSKGLPFPAFQRGAKSVSVSGRSQSMDPTGLQSCGSTRSYAASDSKQGFGGFGGDAAGIIKKKRAGGRHKRKETWAEKPFHEPILTNPVVATFTSEAGNPYEICHSEGGLVGTSGREVYGVGAVERARENGIGREEEERCEPEYIDNVSKRPGLRVVRRRIHVAAEEGEGVERESPGRQAKWKRKAPRAAKSHPTVPSVPSPESEVPIIPMSI